MHIIPKYQLCVSIKYLYTVFMPSDIYHDAYYAKISVMCCIKYLYTIFMINDIYHDAYCAKISLMC